MARSGCVRDPCRRDCTNETAALFEAEFGAQVRTTREMFALRRLIDRDLDAFYRRPSTAFEIGVVARRLAVLAHRLERT